PEAQRIVKALCDRAVSSGIHLRQAALEEVQVHSLLSLEEIDRALDPGEYLGSTDAFIEMALASYRVVQSLMGGSG
ncbi:MAG TPA: hypothetical protein VGT44_14855, partial [Ktedonobacteraceae bacterium]|nr:hypothetical protein [Ktedonobacteraceae bacterium]